MKKILTILVLVTVIPACIFAGSVLGLTAGITGAYQKAELGEATEGKIDVENLKWEDFKFGADVDVKVLFVNVNAKGFIAENTDDDFVINGIVSVNLCADLEYVRLKAGLGYQYSYNTKKETGSFGRNANYFEDYEDACFDIYTGLDVVLGPIVIGAYATLPTGVSIGEGNWNEIFSTIEENWRSAQIGVSLGFALL